MDTPEIFISHNWADKQTAEKIYSHFTNIGIKIRMDNHELKYKDSLKDFMESIRDCDYAILLISDKYLKSKNCLYEVLHLTKEKVFKEKVLPIILDTAKIFDTTNRLNYLLYWRQKQIDLEALLKTVDPINAIEAFTDLKTITEITLLIDSFLKQVSDMLNISLDELQKQNYKPIIEKIGFQDISYAVELLRISLLENVTERELALDEYLTKFTPNTYYYAIKASTYLKEGKFQQAKFNYLESIKQDPSNKEALNNLGNLLNGVFKEYKPAKEYFEKAIELDPKFTIARLNLGVILRHHFNDDQGSKEQYDTILKYDPNEPKAHNNIANYYKKYGDKEKAEYHMRKAIELNPRYVEAYINYGNFLKVNGKISEGNELYKVASNLTEDKQLKELIDTLIKSNKG